MEIWTMLLQQANVYTQKVNSVLVWIYIVFTSSWSHRQGLLNILLRIHKLSTAFKFLASYYAELEFPSISDRESPCDKDADLVKYTELKTKPLLRNSQLPKVVKCVHERTCEDTHAHLRSHFLSPISVKRLIRSNEAHKDTEDSPTALLELHY